MNEAKNTVYMVISSHYINFNYWRGEEKRPCVEEMVHVLTPDYIMQVCYNNTLFAMINSGAHLFKTEGEAEEAILLYSKIESKVIESAKKWQRKHQTIRRVFPWHKPLTLKFLDYVGPVSANSDIKPQQHHLRIVKIEAVDMESMESQEPIDCANADHDADGCLGYSTDRGGYSYCQTCLECPKASINNRDIEQESNDDTRPHRSIVWTPEDSLYVEQGMLYD